MYWQVSGLIFCLVVVWVASRKLNLDPREAALAMYGSWAFMFLGMLLAVGIFFLAFIQVHLIAGKLDLFQTYPFINILLPLSGLIVGMAIGAFSANRGCGCGIFRESSRFQCIWWAVVGLCIIGYLILEISDPISLTMKGFLTGETGCLRGVIKLLLFTILGGIVGRFCGGLWNTDEAEHAAPERLLSHKE
ncbi:MAG: hypothetical protein ABIH23_00690 [bacterium]